VIADYGDGRPTVLLMGTSARWWHNRRCTLLAAGCRLEQDGDTEGSFSFDPAHATASALAIKAAGCRRRKVAAWTLSSSDRAGAPRLLVLALWVPVASRIAMSDVDSGVRTADPGSL
jgi:hypothetical protein